MGNFPTALTARSLQSPADNNLWHRRFGHAGFTRINKATNLVNGLRIKPGDTKKCEDCTIANHKQRPFNAEKNVENNPLERVYIDIFGPTRVESVRGNYY
ncbi:hypothetical protein F5890DRAFT_1422524, partial [Lentinula detonsa]